jgi:hypothetical protein
MVKKLEYYFEEEGLWFTYEVEEEKFMDLLVEKFMDQFNIGDEDSARDLIYRFVGWDSITDTYEEIVGEELKEEAYYKFVKHTVDKIVEFLPYNGPFNPDTYEKVLGFKVPFEGEVWTTLEVRLDRNKVEYEVDEETQTLTIKK